MEDVIREGDVPFFIAKEAIKLAQGWVLPLVAPSEFTILKVDFLELTRVEGVSESNDPASIGVSTILIIFFVNLVKVSID